MNQKYGDKRDVMRERQDDIEANGPFDDLHGLDGIDDLDEPQELNELGDLEALDEMERQEHPLEGALNDLEGILEDRHVVPEPPPSEESAPEPEPNEAPPSAQEPTTEPLPLLDDVVVPGDPDMPPPGTIQHDDLPPHDDLITRLVNELEIIIEGCVDEALANAKTDFMAKMKNHLEIVLPEMLDELSRRRGSGE